MPKGVPNKRYTPEFKKLVIETMHQEHWSCVEAGKHFDIANQRVNDWERIYLAEGPEAFQIERRGRGSQGRPRKLPKEVEEDLLKEVRLFGQKLYLSPILDLYSGNIVTYTLSDSPNLLMVTTMLEQAFAKIPDDTKLLLHSDQGWHYRHKQYVQMLRDKGIRQSMSHKGNCYDNAVMENFFGHLKSELLYLQEFESMEHFKQELIEYIDYYNNRRIKARLKGLPPALHRQQALLAA